MKKIHYNSELFTSLLGLEAAPGRRVRPSVRVPDRRRVEALLAVRPGIVASLPMTFLSLTHGPCVDADNPEEQGYE